jgi:hypothetical protein
MSNRTMRFCIAILAMGFSSAAFATDFSTGILLGYRGGASALLTGTVSGFAQGFPLAFEFGIGHSRLDPGNPLDARRIFINDNENGTPEKMGWMWDLRFDFLYRLHVSGMNDFALLAGVRRALFTANFRYVGGNEDFNVSSDQWGFGLGTRMLFAMNRNVNLEVMAGFDYYPAGTLYGHDTSYSPDGETVNGKHDYTYKDAAAAINQPRLQPALLVGIGYTF